MKKIYSTLDIDMDSNVLGFSRHQYADIVVLFTINIIMLTKLMHASVKDETPYSQKATSFGDVILVCALKLLRE